MARIEAKRRLKGTCRIFPGGPKPGPIPGGNAAIARRFPSRRRSAVAGRQCWKRQLRQRLPGYGSGLRHACGLWKMGTMGSPQRRTNTPPPQARECPERLVRRFDTTWCFMNRQREMLNCSDSVNFAGCRPGMFGGCVFSAIRDAATPWSAIGNRGVLTYFASVSYNYGKTNRFCGAGNRAAEILHGTTGPGDGCRQNGAGNPRISQFFVRRVGSPVLAKHQSPFRGD